MMETRIARVSRTAGAAEPDATNQKDAEGARPEDSVEALEQALESARQRLQERLAEEVERQRAESDFLRRECERLRAEASTIESQAKENAARIQAEAREAAARMLEQTQQTVDGLLSRVQDRAGDFIKRATEELGAVQDALSAARSPASTRETKIPAALAEEPSDEKMVTRLTVRPSLSAEDRVRFKERVEGLPDIYAVLFGAVDDESFEMLIAHEQSATIPDALLALAPNDLTVKDQREGSLEIQVSGTDWLRAETASS